MEEVCSYLKYKDTGGALNNQMLGAVNNKYVAELKYSNIGYANIITIDLLAHLFDQYRTIKHEIIDA